MAFFDDPTRVDPNGDYEISELTHFIRRSMDGHDVREALALGIEKVYDDASENDNANMEVKMARGTNPNLNTRLNKMEETDRQTTAQLAQKASQEELTNTSAQLKISNDVTTSGVLDLNILHPDFTHEIPFTVWRDKDGTYNHNSTQIEDFKATAINLYWGWEEGSDTNDGLSPETPKRMLTDVMDLANSYKGKNVVINVLDRYTNRTRFGTAPTNGTYVLEANIMITPYNHDELLFGAFERYSNLTWTLENGCYKTTRSAVTKVFDINHRGYKGRLEPFKLMSSPDEVAETENSYYTDGTDLWIRRKFDKEPDDDLLVLLGVDPRWFDIFSHTFILDKVQWLWLAHGNNYNSLRIRGDSDSTLILNDFIVAHSRLNGLVMQDVGKTFVFDSLAYDNVADGFNYHGDGDEFVVEVNCEGYSNGTNGLGNNNGSTAHDGMSIVRFGTLAYYNDGPNIADVNGCYSICFGCIGHTSTKETKSNTKAGLFFGGNVQNPPTVYLYDCEGGGVNTYTIGTGVADTVINVRNLKGNDFHSYVELQKF